ncbi:DMT family transporter [Thalassospira marina]|uniref:EamA family transporter n=1 Tax=Thalassospira marina TaxID=2048283 RepID=A0ABM6Q9N9_9PROT|nr:DMT family transporter [Thalassospira marina]AUG53250.1 EamA family transporter [Thalassospira marina]
MVWIIVLFAGFSLIWSSAFIVGKVVIAHLDPIVLLAVRFLLGAACLLPFVLRQGNAFLQGKVVRFGAIAGLLNNALYLGLSFMALQTVPAPVLVVIISCAPLLTSAFAVASGQEPLNLARLAGFTICIAGVVCVAAWQPAGVASLAAGGVLTSSLWAGYAMAIGGTIAFAFGTVFLRARNVGATPVAVNFWQSLVGGLVLFPLAMVRAPDLQQWTPVFNGPVLLAMLYLAIVITLGAMFMWLYLIRRFGASKAAAAHLINPLSGLVLSVLVLGSQIALIQVAGALLIGLGLYIAVFRPTAGQAVAASRS